MNNQEEKERECVVVRLLLLLFLGVVPSRTDDGIGDKRKKKMRRARARDDDDDTILSEGDLKSSFPLETSFISSSSSSSRVKEYFKARTKNVPSLRCRQSIFASCVFPRGVPVDLTERLAPRRRTVMMMIPMMLHLFVSLSFCPFKGTVRRTTERDAQMLYSGRLSSNGSFCKKSIYENETKQAVRDKKKTSSSTVPNTNNNNNKRPAMCCDLFSFVPFFLFFSFPLSFLSLFFFFFFFTNQSKKINTHKKNEKKKE